MFKKRYNGSVGRFRDDFKPVSPYQRRRPVGVMIAVAVILAAIVALLFSLRGCVCSGSSDKSADRVSVSAPAENELPRPTKTKKKIKNSEDPDNAEKKEEPEPFVPKTIDLGTKIEMITK